MDGKIFTSYPCSYRKICVSSPYDQYYKRGPDSSGTVCVPREQYSKYGDKRQQQLSHSQGLSLHSRDQHENNNPTKTISALQNHNLYFSHKVIISYPSIQTIKCKVAKGEYLLKVYRTFFIIKSSALRIYLTFVKANRFNKP